MKDDEEIKKSVKKKYSDLAEKSSCCSTCSPCGKDTKKQAIRVGYSKEEIEDIPEAAVRGLGCGNPSALADLKKGETVLDLGSGAGIDVFLAANKVGTNGKVIGIDMTNKMVKKARNLAKEYGYKNVEFRLGEIENLPVEDNSIDVIISNCVINLSTDKLKTYKEAYRVLKPSGRILISDIVTQGELPEKIKKNMDAWASCIAGALDKNEYLQIIKKSGFKDISIISEDKFLNQQYDDNISDKIKSIKIKGYK